ncbi:MAG: FHA domain-containing protein, partial [Planctomycetota bacterium]|nr:FHA domain-containing protein [Planctomycetota bacterium]
MPKLVLTQWGATQEFELGGEPCTIGRYTGSTIELRGDSLVSRKHAVVTYQNNIATLCDEGSSNGTYLNGVRIEGKTQ